MNVIYVLFVLLTPGYPPLVNRALTYTSLATVPDNLADLPFYASA